MILTRTNEYDFEGMTREDLLNEVESMVMNCDIRKDGVAMEDLMVLITALKPFVA